MILCDDDLIEWDDDYPPQLGQEEDKAQSMLVYRILISPMWNGVLFTSDQN